VAAVKLFFFLCIFLHGRAHLRHRAELAELYASGFKAVTAEQKRRELPLFAQCHTDWYYSVGDEFRKCQPQARVVHGLEHLRRNLRKKQVRTRQGITTRNPRLTKRPIEGAIKIINMAAGMPTLTMFNLVITTMLQRARYIWQEEAWAAFFERQYLRRGKVSEEYGVTEAYSATWWHGIGSWVSPGHGPSQQMAEQMNGHFKRLMGKCEQETQMDTVRRIEKAIALWAAEPTGEESDYSLMAPLGDLSTSPRSPDDYMLTDALHSVYNADLGRNETLPGIFRVLEAHRLNEGRTISTRKVGRVTMHLMAVGAPQELDPALSARLYKELHAKRF
ncbi:unnamed protein product, partial [Effrenium voratum]